MRGGVNQLPEKLQELNSDEDDLHHALESLLVSELSASILESNNEVDSTFGPGVTSSPRSRSLQLSFEGSQIKILHLDVLPTRQALVAAKSLSEALYCTFGYK